MNEYASIRAGDTLCVEGKSLLSWLITRGTGSFTSHNAPVLSDPSGMLRVLQIEKPRSHSYPLDLYLRMLAKNSIRWIAVRPDFLYETDVNPSPSEEDVKRSFEFRADCSRFWMKINMKPYDNPSLWVLGFRVIVRNPKWRAWILDSLGHAGKTSFHCTRGTLQGYANANYSWVPDAIKRVSLPAPVHVERLIRADNMKMVAGHIELFKSIYNSEWINR